MTETIRQIAATASPEAEAFYAESLRLLTESGIPFLLGGTYAVCAYTGISRPTKDIDVFCKAGDFPRILSYFQDRGYGTAIEDERWLGKVLQGELFFDVIFNSAVSVNPVTERWFKESHTVTLFGREVQVTPPTELIYSKAFVQIRHKYDGADVAHLILRQHDRIDWKRLLSYMEQYWEVLLIHLLNFRFIYPSERDLVPQWLMDELLTRLSERTRLPVPQTRICRGRLFSREDYLIDVTQWGFADMAGEGTKND
ncbi:nucleotidyltransferase family protein [Azospirillum halopraeferens]|uniref:nucleotidyltransferase family protein n=1 Tax=Azospirillum halopraeferens TaxID=34010 RepID=UPI00048F2E92|nr:nucleotidyltransferase family protein [Azospirillum halopraeferens]